MLFFLLGFIIFLIFLDLILNNNSKARLIYNVPGPKRHFIVGHALKIMISQVEMFALLRDLAKTFNGIYAMYAFPLAGVCIYNPEDIEIIVSSMKYHEKGQAYKFLKPWLQEGLLVSMGAKWQQRRKILTSAFHFNILQKYFTTIKENDKKFIEKLKDIKGEPVDVVTNISDYTLNTICEAAMGTKLEDQSGIAYKEAIYDFGRQIVYRFSYVCLAPDIIFGLTSVGKLQEKCVALIHKFTKNVIENRKEALKLDVNDNNEIKSKKKRNAMLDLLLSVQKDGSIDDVGIQEEVDTFMFEGHDTSAAALTFCLLMIANYPDIQTKIVKELDSIFGNDTRDPTMDDLAAMRYLDLCIKETMRLYPPVPFIMRKITEPVKLSNYTIPEGTMCIIHIFDLHRNETYYKDAEEFVPERFLPENIMNRHTYAYIPFSAGPRNCIGQKFALMEMKSILSSVLRNFTIAPVTKISDLQFTCDIILRTTHPIYVKFLERK